MATVARCSCGQEMQVLDEDLGAPVECPGCGRSVIVHRGGTAAIPAPPVTSPPPPRYEPQPLEYARAGRPHRGAMILTFGILAFVFGPCFGTVFAILAWAMGNNDLEQMAAGTMDRSGEGLTRAGKILGIIVIVFHVLGVVWLFLAMLLGLLAH